jgi:hypothetical protein
MHTTSFLLQALLVPFCLSTAAAQPTSLRPATVDEALASKQDVWGVTAMRQPNGPTYNFFKDLMPPLRYVNAAFRHYPIVLSAPAAPVKARLTSNGSGINARANVATWQEVGTPVLFFVGEASEPFGNDLGRVSGLHYERGYLPIVHLDYTHEKNTYAQETFVGTTAPMAEQGMVFCQFTLKVGKAGMVSAQLDSKETFTVTNGVVQGTNDQAWVWFNPKVWQWRAETKTLTAHLTHGQTAALAIASKPRGKSLEGGLTKNTFLRQRSACISTWQSLLDVGTQIEVPESYVNDAWRSIVLACEIMRKGDSMHYSALNAYDQTYEAECGDAVRGLALFGAKDTFAMNSDLLDYSRDTLVFHNAGFKLQMLTHLFWLTHDTNLISANRPKWEKEVKLIINSREKESGLFPKERYCGDIAKPVYALNPNANCWRGLRDLAAVLNYLGETKRAQEISEVAANFRTAIWNAVEKSEDRHSRPPFIPMMLFGEEKPYDILSASMLGSYYNLLSPYVIGSGVFGPRAERERWMIDYLQEHSGIAMGLIRFDQHSGLFANSEGVDDLYGIRYTTKLLELDEVDRALVSFYGKLAHGLTRDTFVGGEGTGFRALDSFGRPMYLPPNASSSTLFLWTLRNLLVQDWDLDDDGKPETLRLLFATPPDWLADGKTIRVDKAPTAFGPVSYTVRSALKRGEVIVKVTTPTTMSPKRTLVRARVPAGWKVESAKVGGKILPVDEKGTVDISGQQGSIELHFKVGPR